MKILQVTNFFKPSWEAGGVTRVCYEISQNLVHRGNEVTVYTTDGYDSRLDVQTNKPLYVDGVEVYYFYNLFRFLIKKMKLTTPYYLPFILRKEIMKFDIIHIHEHRTLSAVFVSYYAKIYGIPYVLQSHGSALPFLQKQKLKKVFDYFFGYYVLKNAAKVLALNETEASQYQEMRVILNNIEIIPNGINLSDYNNTPTKGTFRIKYSIEFDCKIILYVGRIHKNKGLDMLINSFSILLKKIPNSKLVIIGPDDGFRTELESLVVNLDLPKNVLFTGFVGKDTKIAALADADIFVTPNFSGFPVTFLEACVFGLPIISTKNGDNLDWIDNKIGYITKYNENDFCEAMVNVLRNESLKEYFATNGKKLILTEFSMDNLIKRIESIYKECILIKPSVAAN
jgi:glycosyltransferase involved in cell wall biosynthesis